MDKDKRLFPFRKHFVGNFLNGGKGKKLKKGMGILLVAVLLFNTLPFGWLMAVASENSGTGLCEHHSEHTKGCGYAEAADCTHVHTEECYTTVTDCVYTHTEECMVSDIEGLEQCIHECSEDSGCVLKTLDCHHKHDGDCGYVKVHECTFICEECSGDDAAGDSASDKGDVETSDSTNAETQEEIPDSTKREECICEALCTEDSINGDCSVCGAEGADLSVCEGKETEEEDTEDCGYIPMSEDGEGKSCTYECCICPIEELIAALPDSVTEGNAEKVRVQIDEILDLYRGLTEEEQEQIDLSHCWELQAELDAVNVPMSLATGDFQFTTNGESVIFTEEECGDSCQGHIITQSTNAFAGRNATILVKSGTHNITFSGLTLIEAKVGVMLGGTMNLTLTDSNTIKSSEAGIYVPVDATLVITEQSTGSLDVSSTTAASIGGAYYAPNGDTGDLNCGTVIINGGTITANGGSCSAGIGGAGGSYDNPIGGNGGTITINGGTVTATGGSDVGYYGGAGIGSGIYNGKSGNGGTLTINGGLVTLSVGTYDAKWGIAYGFGRGNGSNSNAGTLTLADESCLTLADGTTLDPNGSYHITSNLTVDMITVPSDMHYTSVDMAAEIEQKVTISGKEICGQTFRIDMEGWSLSVTKKSDLEYTVVYTHADKDSISKPIIILPCLHSDGATLTHHEKVEADCTHTGVLEYWDCSICGKNFSDKDGQIEITDTEISIAAHTLTHHEKTEADCTQAGNVEYWGCSMCGKKFSDKDGQTEISDMDVEIQIKPHTMTHHARVEAGCLTEGNIEYWNCSVCDKLFSDKDGTKEVTEVKLPAAGHNYGDWQSNGNGTHTHTCQMLGCDSTETKDCFGGTATYTEKAVCELCKQEYGEVLKDTGVPTGEISISTSKWNSFLNTITFGLFFKDTEKVTVTAKDQESSVKSVSYYISDREMSEEEVKVLTIEWTDADGDTVTFGISGDKSCVIYAKITDNQGNMAYISSDGIVFDGTSPSITGVENDKIYCTQQIVTVTDDNLESVTVNGKEVTLLDDIFILDAESGVQIIEAKDKAGNTTTVMVNMGHRYGTEWKSDQEEHWHECRNCGGKSDITAHTKDGGTVTKQPTETETGIKTYYCSVCGYKMSEKVIDKLPPFHTHEFGEDWKVDAENHWHECSCGEKLDSAAHTKDSGTVTKEPTETETGIKTYHCSVCGYKMDEEVMDPLLPDHTHNYSTGWKTDNRNHWHECICGSRSDSAAHTKDSGIVTKPPTETETGIKTYYCSVCGYEMGEEVVDKLSPSHTHSYSTDWKTNSSSHWHECSCGEKSDSAAHTKDRGTITKKPTETETGIKTYHCSVCGYKMGEKVIDKLSPSHTHSYSTNWKIDSSSHWHECSCGEKTDLASHTKNSGTITKKPTETETGIKTYHCSVCGYEMGEEVIDKLSPSHTHSYSTDWKTDSSSHWHECSCGEKTDLASHTKDGGIVTKKPTETETGIKTYHCSVCGYEMGEEVIDKLSPRHIHEFGTDWKTNSNSHWHECSCGEKLDLASHTRDRGTMTKPPTKTETGIKTYQCIICGYVWTEEIAKLQQPSSSNEDSNGSGKESNGSNRQENETTSIKPGTATTKPENETNQDKTPQSDKEPFIKDADGKIGWDVIRAEEEKTEKGNVINVDMNGSTVVQGDIFDRIKGRDITITFDMGNDIIWSVDGKSITTDKADDIDFSVKTVGDAIPIDIVNNVTGERSYIQLNLTHDGDFGFTAVLSINLGKENAGLTARLYYYNESARELEFISSSEVAEDGTALLAFTHASDYMIAVGEEESSGDIFSGEVAETPKPENTGDNDKFPQTGQPWKPWWFVVIGTVLVIIGIGVFFIIRRKGGEE